MAKLKEPARFIRDDRLSPEDKGAVDDINRIVSRLSDSRAIEINIAGPFLRSKMAWKLAVYSQGLQHRIVHLADAVAICWNNKSALGTFLAGRAIIETVATISLLKDRTVTHLATKDLAALNGILDSSTFATRDRVLVIEYPEIAAQNVMTVIGKLDRIIPGVLAHFERMSERCHPNASGHTRMFSRRDKITHTTTYVDEVDPEGNAQSVLASLMLVQFAEALLSELGKLTLDLAKLQHEMNPATE
jgi:hypothetical protein